MKRSTDLPRGGAAGEPVRDAPAFDFFPERWLVGVAGMSDAEQLTYLRLLCHQWLLGDAGLPADVSALKRLGGKGVTEAVLAKLPQGKDGRRRNARLEVVREEQRERIANKSAQRRAAALKRWHGEPGAADKKPPACDLRAHGGSTCENDAADMRPHSGSMCKTDAGGMRNPCGSPCETPAAGMPTTHHSPPTTHPVPEDANNAGAREAWADAAGDAAAAAAAKAAAIAHVAAVRGASGTSAAAANAEAEAAAMAGADAAADQAAAVEAAAADRAAAARKESHVPTPGLDTVLAWAAMIGCPPDKAEIWWHEHEARPLSFYGRWTDRDGNAVQRPQHALAAWWQKWQANDNQRNTRNHPPSSHANTRSTPLRSDSANAPGRYA